MNATGNAERLVARLNFDVLRKSSLHSVNLLVPKSILGHHLILDYTKFFSPFSPFIPQILRSGDMIRLGNEKFKFIREETT